METLEKLKQENRKLKRNNFVLAVYVICSFAIMAYNYLS